MPQTSLVELIARPFWMYSWVVAEWCVASYICMVVVVAIDTEGLCHLLVSLRDDETVE